MRYCQICCEELSGNEPFFAWLMEQGILCGTCLKNIKILNKVKKVNGVKVHVLYEGNDFMHQLWQQFYAGDVALANIFLFPIRKQFIKKYRKYTIFYCENNKNKRYMEMLFQKISIPIQMMDKNKLDYDELKRHCVRRDILLFCDTIKEFENLSYMNNIQQKVSAFCLFDNFE